MDGKKTAVLIACFGMYENRLKYIERYLRQAGYNVLIVISDFDHLKKCRIPNTEKKNLIQIRVPKYKKNVSIGRLYSHFVFAKKVETFVRREKPDFVYTLIPPNYLLRVLKKEKNKIGYKLVADFIDLWPDGFPIGKSNVLPVRMWRRLRDDNIDALDHLVLECGLYQSALKIGGGQCSVLHLIKPNKIKSFYDCETLLPNDRFVLGYLGSINSLIDIDRICETVKKLQEYRPVEAEIIGSGENTSKFISVLEGMNVEVHYHGPVFDEEEKYQIFRRCHFGINIYKEDLKIGLTAKSVDYFNYGLPVLNSIKGDTHDLVDKYGAGINIEDLDDALTAEKVKNYKFSKYKVIEMFELLFSEDTVDKRLKFLDALI